ncbi:MAG: hypothetical protein R3F61_26090 [Myxococcota bacterium]
MFWLILAGCDKTADTDTDGPDCTGVDWASHGEPFVEVCTGCHSAANEGDDRQGAPEALNFDPPGGVEGFASQMVAVGTGESPRMPPDGMEAAIRERFALYVECGLPNLPRPCTGDTWEGDLAVSAVSEGFCDTTRWVTGDLVVDGPQAPIDCLCGVGGDLVVGTAEISLPNLERVDGTVALEGSEVVSVRLAGLERLGGALTVEGNAALEVVELGRLGRSGRVRVRDNPVLETLDVSGLSEVTGSVTVRDNALLGALDLGALTSIDGPLDVRGNPVLSALVVPDALLVIPDTVQISTLPELGALEGFAGTESVVGTVHLEGLRADGVDVLGSARTVGSVQLIDFGPLDRLHGFGALETVSGTLRVANVGPVGDLALFSELREVQGGLVVDELRGRAIIGFPSLERVGGAMDLSFNGALVELRFPVLTEVNGLLVHDNPQLPGLSGLSALTTAGGTVEIYSNPALTSLTGLEGLTVIDGGLRLENVPALEDLSALANLTEIRGDLLLRNVGGYDVPTLTTLFGNIAVTGTITIE